MKLYASRVSSNFKGSSEPLTEPDIYEFDIPFKSDVTPLAECEHVKAFDPFSVEGDLIPRRACPLKPHSVQDGEIPSDNYNIVRVTDCSKCEYGSEPEISLDKDKKEILKAFANHLKTEDLKGEDKHIRRWSVLWDKLKL